MTNTIIGINKYFLGGAVMDTRVALIGIIVSNPDSVESINKLLHSYSEHIIGRMGIPYRKKNISLIAVDAPNDIVSALAGKLGQLDGVSTKTIYNE